MVPSSFLMAKALPLYGFSGSGTIMIASPALIGEHEGIRGGQSDRAVCKICDRQDFVVPCVDLVDLVEFYTVCLLGPWLSRAWLCGRLSCLYTFNKAFDGLWPFIKADAFDVELHVSRREA